MEQEEPYFSDALTESIIGKILVKDPSGLRCEYGQPISRMCINPACNKISLFCDAKKCLLCNSQHDYCATINMKGFTRLLNSKVDFQKKTIMQVAQLENKFVKSFKKTNDQFAEINCLKEMDKQKKIIEQIYQKKNYKCLRGKEAKQLFSKIQEFSTTQTSLCTQKLLKQYENILHDFLKSTNQMKNIISRTLSCEKIINSDIISKQTGKRQGQIDFLFNILDKPRKISRIFKASEHNFKSEAFHLNCDIKQDTLVLIQTEFGKKIGGFTHYPWFSPSDWEKVSDPDHKSFIFSLNMRQKFIPKQDEQLIWYRKDKGPAFGRGHDLYIADRCNINKKSQANFPYTYNREGKNKLKRTDQTYELFSGQEYFRVVEYEVFKVHK